MKSANCERTSTSEAGDNLSDVPADELRLGVTHERERWHFGGDLVFRNSRSDFGSGELPLGSAQLLSATVGRRLGSAWRLALEGLNLLDEEYRRTADDKAPEAPGRSAVIRLSWSG